MRLCPRSLGLSLPPSGSLSAEDAAEAGAEVCEGDGHGSGKGHRPCTTPGPPACTERAPGLVPGLEGTEDGGFQCPCGSSTSRVTHVDHLESTEVPREEATITAWLVTGQGGGCCAPGRACAVGREMSRPTLVPGTFLAVDPLPPEDLGLGFSLTVVWAETPRAAGGEMPYLGRDQSRELGVLPTWALPPPASSVTWGE